MITRQHSWLVPSSFLLLLLLSAIGSWSCGANDITNPNQIIFPDSNVSFAKHVQPFLQLSCDEQGCHSDVNPVGGIRLESWGDVRAINVVPSGGPADTNCLLCLVVKLRDPNHLVPITPTPNQQRGIVTWVREGAKNN